MTQFAISSEVPSLALWLIPGLPLAAFLVLILVGRRLGGLAPWLSLAALATAGMVGLSSWDTIEHGRALVWNWPWLPGNGPLWHVGLRLDGLSWLMTMIVTGIGSMIQLYSIGYMHDDPRFSRFFAYLSLFCASMLLLVLADHFVLLYAGWELVGLCSYLLISFWFEKPEAAAAGRKAFLTTRIGDTGLLLGIFLLATQVGELRLSNLASLQPFVLAHPNLMTWISALIFLGAVGKSAQFPLHVWLPDAMEGPTPVSALIHAATMVAAGVYLAVRALPLFTPQSLAIVLVLGVVTHLFAGTIALTMNDIKRVMAYSTLSQLGLMMVAVGLANGAAAMFHLYTHAFFKALLFLGAGSVIHATHEQDLRRMGGLRKVMPWTAALILIAGLSMSGVPPLSGFWSKDALLLAAQHAHPALFAVLLLGAVMTAAYIARLYLLCFHGQPHHAKGASRGHSDHHTHESPGVMVGPMTVLGIGAVAAGLAGSPFMHGAFFHLIGATGTHEGIDIPVLLWSTGAALAGFGLAWTVGFKHARLLPEGLRPLGATLYTLAANKYYMDEIYQRVIIQPFLASTRALSEFDGRVIDGAVNRAGQAGWQIGVWKERFDQLVVDRLVNQIAVLVQRVGEWGRRLQTGIVQQYLLVLVVSAVALAVFVQ